MIRNFVVLATTTILLSVAPVSADDKGKKAQDSSLAAAGEKLKQAVADGTISKEDAAARFKELSAKAGTAKGKLGEKGKANKGKPGKMDKEGLRRFRYSSTPSS